MNFKVPCVRLLFLCGVSIFDGTSERTGSSTWSGERSGTNSHILLDLFRVRKFLPPRQGVGVIIFTYVAYRVSRFLNVSWPWLYSQLRSCVSLSRTLQISGKTRRIDDRSLQDVAMPGNARGLSLIDKSCQNGPIIFWRLWTHWGAQF